MSCKADLILQAPKTPQTFNSVDPHPLPTVLSVQIAPLEHSTPFNHGFFQTPYFRPISKLSSTSEKRKSYLQQLPREEYVYTLTTTSHPKSLKTILQKLYKSESALLLSYFVSTCHIGRVVVFSILS